MILYFPAKRRRSRRRGRTTKSLEVISFLVILAACIKALRITGRRMSCAVFLYNIQASLKLLYNLPVHFYICTIVKSLYTGKHYTMQCRYFLWLRFEGPSPTQILVFAMSLKLRFFRNAILLASQFWSLVSSILFPFQG